MNAIALRLIPQQDLKAELDYFVRKQAIEAACILTCVGSLAKVTLRLANQSQASIYNGQFEIVSLTGVMSRHGSHYHIAIADETGQTIGGHLLEGCLIYTTAEIVIGVLPNFSFKREYSEATGYNELAIYPAGNEGDAQNKP
jgi:predicted DNA-binding protein with PD1-like motif